MTTSHSSSSTWFSYGEWQEFATNTINRAGFGGSEREPFLGGVLQVDEELLTAAAREEVQVLAFIGTALSGNWTLCEKSRR